MFKIWVLAVFLHASPVDPSIAAFKHLAQVGSLKECTALALKAQKEKPEPTYVCLGLMTKGPEV